MEPQSPRRSGAREGHITSGGRILVGSRHAGNGEMGHGRFLWGTVPPHTAMSPCLEHCTCCWVQHKFPAAPCCFQAFLENGLVSTVFSQMTLFQPCLRTHSPTVQFTTSCTSHLLSKYDEPEATRHNQSLFLDHPSKATHNGSIPAMGVSCPQTFHGIK